MYSNNKAIVMMRLDFISFVLKKDQTQKPRITNSDSKNEKEKTQTHINSQRELEEESNESGYI